mmetsp:Transcript_90000/g.155909  ORF Transcript_90000/g.155909 Transcript_90000/m.155909 type:complete len:195 (+) Transcript_90000:126-710(+)
MKLRWMALLLLLPLSLPVVNEAAVLRARTVDIVNHFHLKQYSSEFCSGTYHAIDLTKGVMKRIDLAEPRIPAVVCNMLTEETDGGYKVDSCPGDKDTGCPTSCADCKEDLVHAFPTLDECKGGWMLSSGLAADASDLDDQMSANKLDIGLARWCDRWPTAAATKTSEDLVPEFSTTTAAPTTAATTTTAAATSP